ncbi:MULTISPECIES: hypothetical protein [Mycobacteroides]|jgi:hypothetical protein|uniref:hypothetical protein n=1 Tax=Mycobacteroides TaxID=670516 RepID=UPI0007129C8A|nr:MULTISPECIES: hypothetical protein [Mycobacteroides]KRQ32557.1 hypothetical protein AOT91_11755 [Mycobacteroides sp. H092]KRQ42098.1 hypothetical protein AOT88_25350 [Mycobacteroides sp. H063]KRQ48035.1 hypothetical protein AOT92_00285 [Mycobacteroides sp. H101]KRQ52904.1 hypothetical protein AOT94_26510 [Mycobacteroides sp. HXVII]KRQ59206.1 hypothetical protein AOT90_23455 [Mycobacteroides sp. H079]
MSDERLDNRVTVSTPELATVIASIRNLITEEWCAKYVKPHSHLLDYGAARELSVMVLRTINSKRLGHAEGTVAVNEDGRLARRYYSEAEKRLTWLLLDPPTDRPVEIDSGPELPGDGWKVIEDQPWEVVQ